jgi:hypothetical protein
VATRISNAARSDACDAVVDLVDVGGPGFIRVYTGPQPAGPDTLPSGTLLAEFTLANPAFGAAVNGVATLDATPTLDTTGLTDGTAGWFRLLTAAEEAGDGQGVLDGSVTATGGGGQLELNTTTISTGVDVSITAGTVTMPGG